MSKRFFAFGCSFTEFQWVTWADIVGHGLHSQGYEYYNFGNSGGGNYNMFCSMFAADAKYKFTDDDIIMVLWSSWTREDRYLLNYGWDPVRGQWTKDGNILSPAGRYFEKNFAEKYWCLENDVIKNVTSIAGARKLFNLAFEGNIGNIENVPSNTDDALLNGVINCAIPNNWPVCGPMDEEKLDVRDRAMRHWLGHPSPTEHMEYVQQFIQPAMPDINLIPECTQEWFEQVNAKTRKLVNQCIDPTGKNLTIQYQVRTDDLETLKKQLVGPILSGDRTTLWGDDEIFITLLDQLRTDKN